jgi:hypothetical protein
LGQQNGIGVLSPEAAVEALAASKSMAKMVTTVAFFMVISSFEVWRQLVKSIAPSPAIEGTKLTFINSGSLACRFRAVDPCTSGCVTLFRKLTHRYVAALEMER